MSEILKGKAAVVTGGGGGIGQAIALALAAHGASIVVADPGVAVSGGGGSKAPADSVADEIKRNGGNAVVSYESVADFEDAGKIVRSCVDNFGRIDILVNSAGIVRDRMCFNMTAEEWDAVLKVHLYGTFYCSRHAVEYMRAQNWGRIVGVTSDAYRGTVGHVNYGAAKGGIVSLMRSMALELGRSNITCNCIAPAAATRLTMSDEVKEGFKKRVEAGRLSQETFARLMEQPGPEFVAPAVVYLASDAGANISGAVIGCGGGKVSIHTVAEEAKAIYKDYRNQGPWTFEELQRLIPSTLLTACPPLQGPGADWG